MIHPAIQLACQDVDVDLSCVTRNTDERSGLLTQSDKKPSKTD